MQGGERPVNELLLTEKFHRAGTINQIYEENVILGKIVHTPSEVAPKAAAHAPRSRGTRIRAVK